MNKENEILKLTKIWYEYVSLNHHKDRDCHWDMEVDWAYGKPPKFVVNHYGYVGSQMSTFCDSYDEALDALLEMLKEVMSNELKWAKDVLLTKPDWDNDQIAQAEFAVKNFNENNTTV